MLPNRSALACGHATVTTLRASNCWHRGLSPDATEPLITGGALHRYLNVPVSGPCIRAVLTYTITFKPSHYEQPNSARTPGKCQEKSKRPRSKLFRGTRIRRSAVSNTVNSPVQYPASEPASTKTGSRLKNLEYPRTTDQHGVWFDWCQTMKIPYHMLTLSHKLHHGS